MTGCIFCELRKKEQNILYQTDLLFVLADVNPLSAGHLLVIPKEHAEFLHELSEKSLADVLPTIKRIINVLGLKKYNILQNNGHIQSVPHVHFHIIPYINNDECLKIKWESKKTDEVYFNTILSDVKDKLARF